MIHFHEVPKNIDLDIIEKLNPTIIFYISNENSLNLFYSKKYKDKIIASFPMYHSEVLSIIFTSFRYLPNIDKLFIIFSLFKLLSINL